MPGADFASWPKPQDIAQVILFPVQRRRKDNSWRCNSGLRQQLISHPLRCFSRFRISGSRDSSGKLFQLSGAYLRWVPAIAASSGRKHEHKPQSRKSRRIMVLAPLRPRPTAPHVHSQQIVCAWECVRDRQQYCDSPVALPIRNCRGPGLCGNPDLPCDGLLPLIQRRGQEPRCRS